VERLLYKIINFLIILYYLFFKEKYTTSFYLLISTFCLDTKSSKKVKPHRRGGVPCPKLQMAAQGWQIFGLCFNLDFLFLNRVITLIGFIPCQNFE